MIYNVLVTLVAFNVFTFTLVQSEILTGTILGVSAIAAYYGFDGYVACKLWECCTAEYVRADIDRLDELLSQALFGQDIARHTVLSALQGHILSPNPPKALTMSFHGPPGTGKTFVTRLIANTFFTRGIESKYYHFFNGRNDFPLERLVEQYKVDLQNTIVESLKKCDKSMFVFDEVDKMPEGLLNMLVPFLDYTQTHKVKGSWTTQHVNKTKAIYIFLSNTGSSKIVRQMVTFWEQGRRREDLQLSDFESIISVGAFNEQGGFRYSDTIGARLIDHFVPFLPLEKPHIEKCLKRAFRERGATPTPGMIQKGLDYMTYGPDPQKLYSESGCKRLEQKAAAILSGTTRA